MTFSDALLSAIIGILSGVASALASWWWLTRYLRPRTDLDEKLSYFGLDDEPVKRSQVRVYVGRRAVVELDVTIRLRMPGLISQRSIENILLARERSPSQPAGAKLRYRVSVHRMPDESFQRYEKWLKKPWAKAIRHRSPIDLREFLQGHPGAEVSVTVIARDAYTGSPSVVHRRFGVDDFLDGPFPKTARPEHTESAADDIENEQGLGAVSGMAAPE